MEAPEYDARTTRKSLLLRLKVGGPTREVDLHQFHQQYAPIIRGFARNIGVRQQDVEDVVHDSQQVPLAHADSSQVVALRLGDRSAQTHLDQLGVDAGPGCHLALRNTNAGVRRSTLVVQRS